MRYCPSIQLLMPGGHGALAGRRGLQRSRDVCDREEVPGLTLNDLRGGLLVPCKILPSVFLGGLGGWVPGYGEELIYVHLFSIHSGCL